MSDQWLERVAKEGTIWLIMLTHRHTYTFSAGVNARRAKRYRLERSIALAVIGYERQC
jgi:hypothetical protein